MAGNYAARIGTESLKVSDLIDQAQTTDNFYQSMALKQSLKPVATAVFTGFCLNCDEPVQHPRRWCDAECRDDWEKERL